MTKAGRYTRLCGKIRAWGRKRERFERGLWRANVAMSNVCHKSHLINFAILNTYKVSHTIDV